MNLLSGSEPTLRIAMVFPPECDQGEEGLPDLSQSTCALIECVVGIFKANVSRAPPPSATRSVGKRHSLLRLGLALWKVNESNLQFG